MQNKTQIVSAFGKAGAKGTEVIFSSLHLTFQTLANASSITGGIIMSGFNNKSIVENRYKIEANTEFIHSKVNDYSVKTFTKIQTKALESIKSKVNSVSESNEALAKPA